MNTKKTVTIEQVYNIFQKYGDLGIKVNTPYGYKHISFCEITAKNSDVYFIETKNKKKLLCSPEHQVKIANGYFVKTIDLICGDIIQTLDGCSVVTKIQKESYKRDLYDIQVDDVEQYYSNGIVSHNSSILDALLFTLFDKTSRCFKGMHVLNVQKSSFKCKLEFEISGIHYFIERKGNTTRSGNVKVDVKFWKIVGGVEEELHGTERRDTNDIIRDYVGTYEDFILTAASFQNAKNNSSFIDMGNSDRKDLMVQFLGLNVFDRLHEAASERNKELNTLLKMHKDKNYQHEIQLNRDALEDAVGIFTKVNNEGESLRKQISDLNNQIIIETGNLIKLDSNVPTNLSAIEARKTTAEVALRQKKQSIEDARKKIESQELEIENIVKKIEEIEASNLVENHRIYKVLTEKITNVKQNIDLKKVEVRGKWDKVERLKTHEYDPKCKYCMNNAFVKDAMKAKTELEEDTKEVDKMQSVLENLRNELIKVKWVEEAYETYTKLLTDKGKIKDECNLLNRQVIIGTNELEKLETSYKSIIQQVELYHRNTVSVEVNEKINSKISSYKLALTKIDVEYQKNHRFLMEVSGKMATFKSQIDILNKTLEDVTAMENESDSYQQYLEAVGRDGISYQVICNTVPEVEKEVNSILSQVVDYTVQFETDGKNIVPYVVYEYGRWPIELTSGYERFVSSVAIRVALTNISNLQKTTFLAIDEGWATLDADNLASMASLFSSLKNNYDFVLVISHIDSIKDMVDKQIEIHHEGSMAKIVYE